MYFNSSKDNVPFAIISTSKNHLFLRHSRYARIFLILILASSILTGVSAFTQAPSRSGNPLDFELFETIRSGDTQKLDSLLKTGADPNAMKDGLSALMAAALHGTVEQMKLLLRHGADVNYADPQGTTALWMAVPDSAKTVCLLDQGANPNAKSSDGYTVLAKVANYPGAASLLKELIQRGTDLKISAPDNMLVYNAAGSCDTAMLGLLLRHGFSPNEKILPEDYPINAALNYRCFENLKMLVDFGANVNIYPRHEALDLFNGLTPLMYAALNNDRPSLLYLLDHGADVHQKTLRGYTVLMLAEQGETDDPVMTQALIDHGAKVDEVAPDGTSALYYARRRGNTGSVAILEKYAGHP